MNEQKVKEARAMFEFVKKFYPAENKSWEEHDGLETSVTIKDFEKKTCCKNNI